MYEKYKNICQNNILRPGKLWLWKKSTPWVLNFPTKNHWKYPSKIEYIEDGLKKFSETYNNKGITSIAFPELGTISGGLDWSKVKNLMYYYLSQLEINRIEIYQFDAASRDDLFLKLSNFINEHDIHECKYKLLLSLKQCELLIENIQCGNIKRMSELHEIKGIGEKGIFNIYKFVFNKNTKKVIYKKEKWLKLPTGSNDELI